MLSNGVELKFEFYSEQITSVHQNVRTTNIFNSFFIKEKLKKKVLFYIYYLL